MIEHGMVVRHELKVRELEVACVHRPVPAFARVTLRGDALAGFSSYGATDHVKVFFPDDAGVIVAPEVSPDGVRRADPGTVVARDYTPRAFRPATAHAPAELDIDFLLHGDGGPAVTWAQSARQGDSLVVGGPRGSHLPPTGAGRYVLGADESALPALARWIELLPDDADIHAHVTVEDASTVGYLDLPGEARTRIDWLERSPADPNPLERAIRELGPIAPDTFVWLAGEATALIPVRRYLRRELGLAKDQIIVDGYWKRGIVALDHHAPLDPTDADD